MRSPRDSLANQVFILLVLGLCGGPPLTVAEAGDASRDQSGYEANERGVQYLERGKLKEAIREFERAHQLDSDNKVIRGNLSVAYNNYSVELMQEDRYLEAREYLERAARLNPDDARVRENMSLVMSKTGGSTDVPTTFAPRSLESAQAFETIAQDFLLQGIQYFEKKEYELARDMLLESLKYSDENPTAYELLGDVAYKEQDLEAAKEHYASAFRLRRSKALEEKIEKVVREAPVEEKLDPYSDEHFIIRYKEGMADLFGGGFEIREYLRQAYKAVSQDFGFYPRDRVVVLMYSEEEYRELSNTPAWTGGHFDGKIRLPAYKDRINVRELNKLIWHELTHSFVQDLSRGRCPTWLNEGLAQYQENKVKKIDLRYFKKAVEGKYLLSFDELEKGISDDQNAVEILLFYQQSFVVARHLIDRHRMFKIKEMLAEYGKGKTSDQVFKDKLRLSRRTFEIKWLASLKDEA